MVEPLQKEPISGQTVFEAAKDFLEQEFGMTVHITMAEESELVKATTARPSRPAIIIDYVLSFSLVKNAAAPAASAVPRPSNTQPRHLRLLPYYP